MQRFSFLSNAGYGSNALRQTHVPKASSNLDATKRCPGSTLPSTWDWVLPCVSTEVTVVGQVCATVRNASETIDTT